MFWRAFFLTGQAGAVGQAVPMLRRLSAHALCHAPANVSTCSDYLLVRIDYSEWKNSADAGKQ